MVRNSNDNEEKIILRETRESKIDTLLYFIDVDRIKELTLVNNATPCLLNLKLANYIGEMVNLRVLRIFWIRDLSEKIVCTMLKNL